MDCGVAADRLIYANPCKTRSFIAHAMERDVRMMTFDNYEELLKVAEFHPNSEMILRIAVSDPTATCPLNLKFGCDPVTAAPKLLKQAHEEGVNVVGISFHVGSGCNDASAYRTALQHAKNLCEIGEGFGFKMNIIDMGGGFPGAEHSHNPFEKASGASPASQPHTDPRRHPSRRRICPSSPSPPPPSIRRTALELRSKTTKSKITMTVIHQMELIGSNKIGVLPKRVEALQMCREIACEKDSHLNDSSFMLVDLDKIVDRYNLWKRELPMIEPFYAVKCNTDPVLVRILATLGCGFDCASKEEIDVVMDCGVAADRLIYANPCKTRSFIAHAMERDVRMMTFDNYEELLKVAEFHPNSEMILRIAVSDPTATCPLNLKFGCDPVTAAPKLLKQAHEEGVNVVGISFHVGSGCNDASAYRTALQHAKNLCEIGEGFGFKMNIIDMGGGFPGAEHSHNPFEKIAETIRDAIDEFFPDTDKRLIAEPGRFFAAGPFSLVANIIHATQVPASKITKNPADDAEPGFMYYINDGVYGSFNCILFDHAHPVGFPLFDVAENSPSMVSTIWGPTCDSLDLVEDKKLLPKMAVGDWLYYPDMGAYTLAAATTFNGFSKPVPMYVMTEEMWHKIRDSCHI
uniref:ornithine decarboxylase n=1 Tax=Caenorhabditis japonica TaxID=281687 RepID=A0A8R1DS30_CAEJA